MLDRNPKTRLTAHQVAENLSEEEIGGLKELVEMTDIDNNRAITFDELKKDALKHVGAELMEPEIKDLMDTIKNKVVMHHSCSDDDQSHWMGHCTCGMYHSQTSPYSMLFSMPYDKPYEYDHHESDMYSFTTTPSSCNVDCTLSLGTPSTRSVEDEEKRSRHERRSLSNFCWNLLQPKCSTKSQTKASSRGNNSNNTNDSILFRCCANCDTTSTPLWRNGPQRPESLCNACGIRFKKEERRELY
ncbi:unnamed protein product [Lupinus luteus]|uniref:GATA-type domain-containing protein n=1 Tax=Lupinus luteus TaxID=3873 RepID=A0AAV1Y2N0_LUPLU